MTVEERMPWRRQGTESFVIFASILFAIDLVRPEIDVSRLYGFMEGWEPLLGDIRSTKVDH